MITSKVYYFTIQSNLEKHASKQMVFMLMQCSDGFRIIIAERSQTMNRKNQDREEQSEPQEGAPQTIVPKFAPNWVQVVRFDRMVIKHFRYTLSNADCEYEVLPKVAKSLKWKAIKDSNCAEWDVWWTDWAVTAEILMKMEHHQKINHFPGMHTLSRKNLLAKNLMKMRKKCPEEYNFFPLTWTLPGDYQELKAYYDTKPKGKARTYIVKPESLSQGKGIFLTRKIDDINPQTHCVVQRYLSRPYLIEGLKFDLRIYVLLAGVDPLRVFIFREGLARFATDLYVTPNKDNMEDICMHLTNYAINKESDKFIFNQDANDMGIGHKRSLQSVFGTLREKGVDTDALKLKIQDVIVKTIISGLSSLRFQYRSCQSQNYRGDMCFQLLGFDIIINDDVQPILLEINYTPSFSTDTPLDQNIKFALIRDTLMLMQLDKEFKEATVRQRKQCRDLRMMTGKKNKLTQQEKEEKRRQAMRIRDEYMDSHLGGFTKIYPLPIDNPRQQAYEDLIKLQGEVSGNAFTEPKKSKIEPQAIIRRNTQKISKLPAISSMKEPVELKDIARKLISSKKAIDMSKLRIAEDENTKQSEGTSEDREALGFHEMSQKIIRKIKMREVSVNTKKKSVQVRETLVPKTIQFEGNRLDGLCDYYKPEFGRQNE